MGNLPEEVIEEILSRLPVESLVRFKCVCKSWLALFKNPKFVSKHMSNQSNENLVLHRFCQEKGNIFYLIFEHRDDVSCIVEFNLNALPSIFEDDDDGYTPELVIHGHCNGIVALSDCQMEFILWNPGLRQHKFLPDSFAIDMLPKGLHAEPNGVGFGYDPKTDDYKFVRIVDFIGLTDERIRYPSKAEVFSLHRNPSWSWREIDDADVDADILSGEDLEQYFDGVYYWQGYDYITHERVLVSFDMGDEVFSRAPMPDFCSVDYSSTNERLVNCLGVFNNESIALFTYKYRKLETIEVWVMKEFGVKESWTKQLTIGPLRGVERPIVFWKNDMELVHKDVNGVLVFYNLATMRVASLPINGVTAAPYWTGTTYKKTLVSLKVEEEIAA